MNTITTAAAAYKWLRKQAEASKKRKCHYLFPNIYAAANRVFNKGQSMRGIELDDWEELTASLAGQNETRRQVKMSNSVAKFTVFCLQTSPTADIAI